MANAKNDKTNLTDSLKQLETIVEWFNAQEDVDVEAGLNKVKEAAKLIKSSKARLAEIENEFHEIEKEIASDSDDETEEVIVTKTTTNEIDIEGIPFT